MILIDTSAWIAFLKKNTRKETKLKIAQVLEFDLGAYTCPIRFELLSGVKKNEREDLLEALSYSRHIFFNPTHWDKAAEIENILRKKGITVPRDDIFVAACALKENLNVMHIDKHFEMISKYLPLKTTSLI